MTFSVVNKNKQEAPISHARQLLWKDLAVFQVATFKNESLSYVVLCRIHLSRSMSIRGSIAHDSFVQGTFVGVLYCPGAVDG